MEDKNGQEEDVGGEMDEGKSGDGWRCAVTDGGS